MCYFIVIIVPVGGLAPQGAWESVGTMMTKFEFRIHSGPTLEGS